ncbi:MAG TPA: ATP-binding domain-containing protein, partial [Propionicimonas sp.]|nr:ATP-binding domain-containing protein [Propionicimonas sp.]
LPVAIRTTGVEPLQLTARQADLAAELDRQVAALAESVEGTIGVIAAPSRLDSLSSLATSETGAIQANAERVVFLSPLNAKGLEFDAVIVVGPDEIVAESPGGVRVLYVALTRPTQRLVTLDVGESAGAWRESLR